MEFILVDRSREYLVSIVEVVSIESTHFKVVTRAAIGDSQFDYLDLHCPLIVDLRYLAYFVKATLSIDHDEKGGLLQTSIDMLKWDGVEEFKLQMYEKER